MSPFLVLAALLPAALLLLLRIPARPDRKEPASVLWALLGCGAAAALLAYLLETLLTALLDRWLVRGSMAYLAAENFLVVACTEELCKRLPSGTSSGGTARLITASTRWSTVSFSALGFAALENVLYVADSGFRTAVMRALLSVPGHFFFAVYMGVYLGEAKSAETRGLRRQQWYYLLCSAVVPILLHGFWDFDLSLDAPWATIVFYAFVLIFFLRANGLLLRASANDTHVAS